MNGLSEDAKWLLKNYQWKGNIRELKNMIERAVILEDGETIEVNDLPFELRSVSPDDTSSYDLSLAEKLHIQKVLQHTNGNKTEAARLLNIGLTTLYRKMEEYHLPK